MKTPMIIDIPHLFLQHIEYLHSVNEQYLNDVIFGIPEIIKLLNQCDVEKSYYIPIRLFSELQELNMKLENYINTTGNIVETKTIEMEELYPSIYNTLVTLIKSLYAAIPFDEVDTTNSLKNDVKQFANYFSNFKTESLQKLGVVLYDQKVIDNFNYKYGVMLIHIWIIVSNWKYNEPLDDDVENLIHNYISRISN